jgi:hypothetical protein
MPLRATMPDATQSGNGFDEVVDQGAYEQAILDRARYREALERLTAACYLKFPDAGPRLPGPTLGTAMIHARKVLDVSDRSTRSSVQITDKALHAAARELCHQVYGDWRYDPGNRRHGQFRRDAEKVLRAAVPFMEANGA